MKHWVCTGLGILAAVAFGAAACSATDTTQETDESNRTGPVVPLGPSGATDTPETGGIAGDSAPGSDTESLIAPTGGEDVAVTDGPWSVREGGYVVTGSWHGYAWTHVNGDGSTMVPADFSDLPEGGSLCISGTVAPMPDWSGIAMIGINLAQDPGTGTAVETVRPTGTGIFVDVDNRAGSPLRLQIQGPNGADDANDRWCAPITANGGVTIPYTSFNTECWENGNGVPYAGQPITSAIVLVPGSNTSSRNYDVCVNRIEQTGTSGSGTGTDGTDTSGGDTAPQGIGPVGYYGELQCRNGKIYGARTNAVAQVRGMSFFWSNWSQELWREDVVDRMVDEFKAELIRLPYGIQNNGTPYDTSDVSRVETLVRKAAQRGIYAIIDWHSHGANNNPGAATEFFGRMAAEFGDLDNVVFEVFNEPVDQSWGEVKSYAQQVLAAIRQHSDNLVLVGTPHWSQDVDLAARDPLADDNVALVLHFYAATHKGELRAKGDSALNAGQCLFVSEWGATPADGGSWENGNGWLDYASTGDWLAWMDQHNISWANWSIMNKEESSSIFNPGTEDLSEAGNYLKSILTGYVASNPWR